MVLDTMALHPGRAILLLIDTQGQQLRPADELLGINRRWRTWVVVSTLHPVRSSVIGLVYDQALSAASSPRD